MPYSLKIFTFDLKITTLTNPALVWQNAQWARWQKTFAVQFMHEHFTTWNLKSFIFWPGRFCISRGSRNIWWHQAQSWNHVSWRLQKMSVLTSLRDPSSATQNDSCCRRSCCICRQNWYKFCDVSRQILCHQMKPNSFLCTTIALQNKGTLDLLPY